MLVPAKVARNQEHAAEDAYRVARLRRERGAKGGDPHAPIEKHLQLGGAARSSPAQ